VLVVALALSAASLEAQRRRMTPPPDHWMTLDSVVAAVGVTDAQRADVAKHYEGVNAVMKRAADERRAMREQMGGGGMPSEEQRAAMRAKFEEIQKEIDVHYFALQALLAPEQQAKFDALPRPRLGMMGRPPGRP
jgi:hypothetical protein